MPYTVWDEVDKVSSHSPSRLLVLFSSPCLLHIGLCRLIALSDSLLSSVLLFSCLLIVYLSCRLLILLLFSSCLLLHGRVSCYVVCLVALAMTNNLSMDLANMIF
ncbi:hypothetical protein GE09DRAFT_1084399 [Coniochaeta sp. 2T2.1]|nr:hypothetical protein GE09DRAFT_1084399 [Coniochaeta sp. 2T2.1]